MWGEASASTHAEQHVGHTAEAALLHAERIGRVGLLDLGIAADVLQGVRQRVSATIRGRRSTSVRAERTSGLTAAFTRIDGAKLPSIDPARTTNKGVLTALVWRSNGELASTPLIFSRPGKGGERVGKARERPPPME